jgi:Bacteriocin class II with double-glycine leader peptide
MAKGGGGQQQSGQSVNEPWSGQQPYLTDIFKKAQGAYNQTSKTPFPGEYIADPSQTQQNVNRGAYDVGQTNLGQGTDLANFGLGQTYQQFLNPGQQQVGQGDQPLQGMNQNYMNLAANPNLMPALQAGIKENATRAREELFPAIGTGAWNAGAYGGSGHGVALARSARDVEEMAGRQTQDALSNLWAQTYGTERGIQASQEAQLSSQQAARDAQRLGLAPQLAGQGYGVQGSGLQTMQGAGGQEQMWRQDQIDDMLAQWNAAQQAPWTGLDQYAQIVGGTMPGGSGTSTQYKPKTSTFGNFLGGALGGATTGAMVGGPWGAAIGGVGGGLMGAFM